MKGLKFSLVIMAAVLFTFGFSGKAFAFHHGGVADCAGCHSMHNAVGGALLTASDESSVCLNCHNSASASSYHVSTDESVLGAGVPPGNMTPGGDFGWLKKDYVWNPGWAPQSEDGDTHGHNIIAADFNYLADASNTSTPGGGSIDPTDLACSSCHDQHSKLRRTDSTGTIVTTGAPIVDSGSYGRQPITGEAVGVYRLLRGTGSDAGTGGVNYTVPPMAAITPGSYNRSEALTDTRVAYGAGVSDWCATCHPDMHTDSGNLVHPVDQNLFSTIAGNYNSYVGSGDTSGSIGTAYDSLIPFAFDNSTDYAALALQANSDGSFTDGPASTDRVMCLTCHRAHASGWEYSGRWDLEKELIIVDGEWPGTDATSTEAALPTWAKGRSVLERTTAYNDKPATRYATYQRSLCNKCHLKD